MNCYAIWHVRRCLHAAELGTPVHADSRFAFRPVGKDPERGSPRALAQLFERLTGLPASGAR